MIGAHILFVVAGGSGGHILPAIQLAQQWRLDNPAGTIVFFTGTSNLETAITTKYPFINRCYHYSLAKFSLKRWWLIPIIFAQSLFIMASTLIKALRYKPERIITTGGLLSIPVCYAARLAGVMVDLYELNVIPGKAASVVMHIAKNIYVVFEKTKRLLQTSHKKLINKVIVSNYPLRFTLHDKTISKHTVISTLNQKIEQLHISTRFNMTKKTIFVVGGSQGSAFLNQVIKQCIIDNQRIKHSIQIIHQTGSHEQFNWSEWYESLSIPAYTFSYDNAIARYYVLADLVITRAGAGTLFELAFFNKKSIIIPLITHTTTHQHDNAVAIAHQYPHLFTVISQEDIIKNPVLFYEQIIKSCL